MTNALPSLPDRKLDTKAEDQGLFRKFTVLRSDGSSEPGGKHFGCEYFVLDVGHDPHAKAALSAYADSVEPSHPVLAADMRKRYELSKAVREAEPKWQPIETAEKEKDILGYWKDEGVERVVMSDDGDDEIYHILHDGEQRSENPTHWMPLPIPPAAQEVKP